jgi:hypothetical protein
MNEVAERSGAASIQVDQHISSFHNVTTKVLADLGGLAGQFEKHGRSLAEAISLVDQSNRRTEETFAERRSSIQNVIGALDLRTEDIEQRLTRFSKLLDESLEGANERARDIARVIADSSTQSLQAMETERQRTSETLAGINNATSEALASINSTTSETMANIHRSNVETLQSIYNKHGDETNELFAQTTQRFAETLQGMKQMATDMQREIEATRTELRRGILELPQETSESAAQMRRVIVDQIEALAELNRIVARHGRGIDVAEAARREPVMASAGARMEAPRTEPPRMEPPRMEPPRQAPPPRAEMPANAPLPPRRTEAPSLSPGSSGNGGTRSGGWLSDLLHRASRPEEPAPVEERVPRQPDERPARHTIESLDSLSVDIARMIDHDAAAELWDRYKRGERNVFTRRLYTLQGQKTFDEIRRKYRGDREFKQTVDRYIGEFERLLEEVARDDRGQVVARTYLTSETGKVYTMLAHAAGRFGGE